LKALRLKALNTVLHCPIQPPEIGFFLKTMASFCLAGNVQSDNFSHAERLLDILHQTLPVCDVVKYVCLQTTWAMAQEELCKSKNFDRNRVSNLDCIVWHEDGRLIGGASNLAEYCKNTYNVSADIELSMLNGITKENVQVVTKMFEEAPNKESMLLSVDNTPATATQY
jgi:hypothetical protein